MLEEDKFSVDPVTRRELMQAIGSHYYNITDSEGQPMGALLVLLDRQQQPVRAELHLHDEFSDEQIGVAIRQARHLLTARYAGHPGEESIAMQVRESFAFHESIQVPLGDPAMVGASEQRWSPWRIGAGMVALALIVGLAWALLTFWRGGDSSGAAQTVGTAEGAANSIINETAAAETPSAESNADPAQSQQANALPTSIYADRALAVGVRVRITPGYTLTLRSEAGADAGNVVGYMVADPTVKLIADTGEEVKLFGPEAAIINGPLQTKGRSDTIVWWYVQFEDATQAWAAANTSEVTLLQYAP